MKKEEMEAAGFSETDVKRRLEAYREKTVALKDPNNFVSPTRLSVRYLPLGVDETQLKQAARQATARKLGKAAKIRQAKIVRDKVRMDQTTGALRSRGFGFLEFFTHEDALAALEGMNNNRELFGSKARPVVDFAIENSFAMAKLKASIEKSKAAGERKRKEAEEQAKSGAPRAKIEIAKWKLDPALRKKHEEELQQEKAAKKQARLERMEKIKAKKARQSRTTVAAAAAASTSDDEGDDQQD